MSPRNFYFPVLVILFAAICVHSLTKDLASISLTAIHKNWPQIIVVGLLSLLNYALRAARWRTYIKAQSSSTSWRFDLVAFMSGFAFTLSPGKLGEMIRVRYYSPLGLSKSGITGAFLAERVFDLGSIAILSAVAITELSVYKGTLIGICVAVCSIFVIAAASTYKWRSYLSKLPIATKTLGYANESRHLFSPKVIGAGLSVGLIAWGAEAVGLKILAESFSDCQISVLSAIGIYSIAILIGALSFLPGGLGSTEAVMTALLYSKGMQVEEALLTTMVCRALTLWLAVAIGWLCVMSLRKTST